MHALDPEVDPIVARAVAAQHAFESWSEGRVDALLGDIAQCIADHAEELAIAAVEETGMGNVADKTHKNRTASAGIYQSLVGKTATGPLRVDLDQQLPRFHRIAGTHRDRDDAPVHLGGDRRLAHRFDDRFHPRGAMALDVRDDCGLSGCGVRCSREREHKPAPNGRCPCVPMPMRFHLFAPSWIDSPELERLVAARL